MKKFFKLSCVQTMAVVALMLGNVLSPLVYGQENRDRRQQQSDAPAPAAEKKAAETKDNQRQDQPAQRRESPQRREQAQPRAPGPQEFRAERMPPARFGGGPPAAMDRREGRFRTPDWQMDARLRHGRYPRYGTVITTLPPNYYDVRYRGNRFYYQNGIWFRNGGAGFIVTAPPPGVIVPMLPSDYTVVPVGQVPYYYANGVYYAAAPSASGYVVVDPPPGIDPTVESGSDNFFNEPATVVNSGMTFVYRNGAVSDTQMLTDRDECSNWAAGQTAYDAATTPPDTQVYTNYQIAVKACMEGRGYIAQ